MKQPSLLMLLSICASACATSGRHVPESALSDGLFNANHTALVERANPATSSRAPSSRNHYRLGFFASGGYELGHVDDFINRIDDLESELKANARHFSLSSYINQYGYDGVAIANAVVADLNVRVIDVVNRQISLITTDSSYATVFGSLSVPVRFSQPALGGSVDFSSSVTAARDLWAVGDPLEPYSLSGLEDDVTQALTSDQPSVTYLLPDTDTTLLVRTAIVDTLSLGFSRSIGDFSTGQLLMGMRSNYYKVKLSRYAKRMTDFAREELSNEYQNTYSDDNAIFRGAPGLDVGVSWITRRLRVGAMLNNVNQPRFQYNLVDAADYSDAAVPQRLNENRTWTMKSQLRFEGGLNTLDRTWSLGTTVDGNAVEDPLGHEYRWFSAGAAYTPRSTWVPAMRVKYLANTVGSEIRYVTTGFTLFNCVSLDMTRSLDSVYIEKNDAVEYSGRAPRSLIYSLRVELGI